MIGDKASSIFLIISRLIRILIIIVVFTYLISSFPLLPRIISILIIVVLSSYFIYSWKKISEGKTATSLFKFVRFITALTAVPAFILFVYFQYERHILLSDGIMTYNYRDNSKVFYIKDSRKPICKIIFRGYGDGDIFYIDDPVKIKEATDFYFIYRWKAYYTTSEFIDFEFCNSDKESFSTMSQSDINLGSLKKYLKSNSAHPYFMF